MMGPKTRRALPRAGGIAPSVRPAACALFLALAVSPAAEAQVLRGSFDTLPGADSDLSPYSLGTADDTAFETGAEPEAETTPEDGAPPPLAPLATGRQPSLSEPVRKAEPVLRERDVRRSRQAEDDPYEQLGIRAGAFVLRPSIEVYGGYETNPLAVTPAQGSAAGRTEGVLDVQSDWVRHEFRGRIEGEYTAYEALPELNAPRYSADAALRIDARRDLRLDFALRSELDSQSPGDPELPAGIRGRPENLFNGGSASAIYKPNRLSLGLKGEIGRRTYEDAELNDGTPVDNEDENYVDYTGTFRSGYELHPGLEPFAEVSANARDYDLRLNDAGVLHNSDGYRAFLGARIEPNPLWALEGKIGYGRQEADDPAIAPLDGLVAQASLIWQPSVLTKVTFTAKKDFAPTGLECCVIAKQVTTSIEVEHELRRYLILSGSLGFNQERYDQVDYTLRDFAAELGLEYKFNRTVSAKARVAHERTDSSIEGEDYDTTLVEVGLRVQR